jgi:hypothetical protein
MEVHVFKTNVSDQQEKQRLAEVFEGITTVIEWSVDLEDVDKVLRVVSSGGHAADFINKVRVRGFFCEELD